MPYARNADRHSADRCTGGDTSAGTVRTAERRHRGMSRVWQTVSEGVVEERSKSDERWKNDRGKESKDDAH